MYTKFEAKDFESVTVDVVPDGETIKVERSKEGHISEVKEFDFAVVDFGKIFDQIRSKTIPLNDRINNSSEQIEILCTDDSSLRYALEQVTMLANVNGAPYENDEKRFQYQQALSKVCKPMVESIYARGIDNTLGVLMERGALLIGGYFDFPYENIARIVAKRLDKRDGTFGLGLSNLRLPRDISKFNKLHIQEDCIATGDSIGGLIFALKKKGIVFEEIQIDCPVATQFGVEFLIQFLSWLGVINVTFTVGTLVYSLSDHYYLLRTPEEGYEDNEMFVGDMGEWSRILPKTFNEKAPWNKVRFTRKYY